MALRDTPKLVNVTPPNVLPACDNLTDFVGHSRGLDLALDSRPWRNITEFDHLFHADTFPNITCLEHAPQLTNATFYKVVVLALVAVLSFAANVATIYSITRNRRRLHTWSAIYTLILHLSVADLLVTVFCIGGEAVWSYTVAWIWGNVSCKLFKFLQVFSLYLSTFVLVLIGVDRFFAVRYPMKGFSDANRCSKLLVLAWIFSFVLAAPQIIIFRVSQGPFIERFTQCVTYGFYTQPWQEQLYVSLSLFFMFLLPLAILIATYVSTVITISRNERIFKVEMANNDAYRINGDINRRKLMHRARIKSLRISVVIVAAFVLWWTPYYTMMIIFMFLNPDKRVGISTFHDRANHRNVTVAPIPVIQLDASAKGLTTFLAKRGTTKWNLFLRYEQLFGQSFDIWRLSPLAATEATQSHAQGPVYDATKAHTDHQWK